VTAATATRATDAKHHLERRNSLALDWLLIVASLASALWACRSVATLPEIEFRQVTVQRPSAETTETWFIDDANVIHWPEGSAGGAAGLAYSTTTVPAQVQLLVHPDSLVEPLMRSIDALCAKGARQVHVAISADAPFSTDRQQAVP
jgi:hypothetical protein